MSLNSNPEMLKQLEEISQETEISKFEKYSTLVPELQRPVLAFLRKKTLRAFSQCSKKCNEEVQKFNTVPPTEISLSQESKDVQIYLTYDVVREIGNSRVNGIATVEKTLILHDDSDGQELEEHLRKYYKYVKTGRTDMIDINLKQWPTRIMNLPMVAEIKTLDVTIYESMLDSFMKYFQTREANVEEITIDVYDNYHREQEEKLKLPSTFFKFPFLKNVQSAKIHILSTIDDTDFINLHIPSFEIEAFINSNAIRQKVALLNTDPTIKLDHIKIWIPDFYNRWYNIDDLFPEDEYFEERSDYHCVIGRVRASVEDDGKVLMLALN